MRLLMDHHGMGWDESWDIVTKTMAYTNHTLLPEALEKWSVGLFNHLLPRLMEIIYEINARFMRVVANKFPGDTDMQSKLSIIEDGPHPQVRMAHLAIVGSYSVNGVANYIPNYCVKASSMTSVNCGLINSTIKPMASPNAAG